jgi:hypothetical protein
MKPSQFCYFCTLFAAEGSLVEFIIINYIKRFVIPGSLTLHLKLEATATVKLTLILQLASGQYLIPVCLDGTNR